MNKIRVLIADDHAFVRMGIAALLGTEADIEVVGEAKDGVDAVAAARRLMPDVAILDLMMPKMDGVSATKEILRRCPDTKVILITSFSTADGLALAIDAGAVGVVLKNADNGEIISAIRKVTAGESAIPAEVRRQIRENPPVPSLSPRQEEVLKSLTLGLRNKEIATRLGISVDRVEEHVAVLCSKIGATNRAEAVAIALRKQLLKI